MAWSSAELTDSGLELLSKLINGGKLTITRAAVGRGIIARTDSEDEVLLAIMQDEIGEEIPPYAEFPDFLIEFNLKLGISRTNNITVMTDSGAVATGAAHSELFARLKRRVVATRIRDPEKPDYGVGEAGGGGDTTGVALITADYTGNAEVTVVINGKEYDGKNISRDAENAPNGTLIFKEEK